MSSIHNLKNALKIRAYAPINFQGSLLFFRRGTRGRRGEFLKTLLNSANQLRKSPVFDIIIQKTFEVI
jgi:hypothetical protein